MVKGMRSSQLGPQDSPRRIELITELLRLSADPLSIAAAWEGVKGSGTALPVRPHEPRCSLTGRGHAGNRCTCWLRSLDELENALGKLKEVDRPCWYAVNHRYRLATRQPRDIRFKGGKPMLELNQYAIGLPHDLNKRGDGTCRLLVETWRAGLNPEYITEGVRQLAVLFRGSPELPLELVNAA